MGHHFTEHALKAIAYRGLDAADVMRVLDLPDAIEDQGARQVLQRTLPLPPDGRSYLLSVVVERWGEDTVVITAYRTTKFAKYGATP